jgi:hypothetical protein
MTTPSIAARFTDLLRRSISKPVYRAIQADAIASQIGEHRSWINRTGHGALFSALQVSLADELVLCVTRMFDPPHPRHPTQSIPVVLQFMRDKARWLKLRNRAPLERLLVTSGASASHVQGTGQMQLTQECAAHFQAILPNPERWKSDALSASLRALRYRRNKEIAHEQTVSVRHRVRAAWDDARSLILWALRCGEVIGGGYLDYHFLASDNRTFLSDHLAREAAHDLDRLLDKAGLPRGPLRREGAA